MLRRMKDEVNKHKARADDLETKVASGSNDGSSDSQLKEDLDMMRSQIKDLLTESKEASSHNKELQHRLATVSADYDSQLKTHAAESTARIAELEQEVQSLHEDLNKAHQDLEETLSLNHQLNGELANALQRPSGSPGHAKSASFNSIAGNSEAEMEVQRQREKVEWLEEENKNLTMRYQLAEKKLVMLLEYVVRCDVAESDPRAAPWRKASCQKLRRSTAATPTRRRLPGSRRSWSVCRWPPVTIAAKTGTRTIPRRCVRTSPSGMTYGGAAQTRIF
jgi:polyhydroxyalkanoate synthesis regulator phasin